MTNLPTEAITVKDGKPITNSRIVAEIFGKQHFHVTRDIENLDCSQEFRQSNFGAAEFTDAQGKIRPAYDMTKDGFTFLVMGYTGAKAAGFKEAYIQRFNEMEVQLKAPDGHLSTAILNLTAAIEHLTAQLTPSNQAQPIPKLAAQTQKPSPVTQFLTSWWDCVDTREVTAKDLYRIITNEQCPMLQEAAINLFGPTENWTSRRLGNKLRTWSQRSPEGFSVLNKGKTQGGIVWHLERTQ